MPQHPVYARTARAVAWDQSKVVNISSSKTVHCHGTTPTSPFRAPFSMAKIIFFSKQHNNPLLRNTICNSACQPHDCRHVAWPCCWWLRPPAPGPGPSLASIWLNKPLLPEELSTLEVLCAYQPHLQGDPFMLFGNATLTLPFSGFGSYIIILFMCLSWKRLEGSSKPVGLCHSGGGNARDAQ